MTEERREPKTLRDYLQVVRRRKWLIVVLAIAVPTAALVLSLRQESMYAAKAEVLLSRQNLSTLLSGAQDPTAYLQAERFAQTQASLAESPEVAASTLQRLTLTDRTAVQLLGAVSVRAKGNADILVITVRDRSPSLAAQLATEYARQFTEYRKELDTRALERARVEVDRRIRGLEAEGNTGGRLYNGLLEKEQQLRTMEALQTSNASLVRVADRAPKVQPRPMRNAIFGLVLGLIAGVAIAFLWEALDTRVRTVESLAAALGLPLLARVPAPPKRAAQLNRLVMLHDPNDEHSEAFRMLRTNLEFANLDLGARTIMVTSAVQGEGKSTTVANLAVALARGGRHVVLVDLDLRRPKQHEFFDLRGKPGLTQVALGQATLDEAITSIAFAGDRATFERRNGRVPGTLEVLGTGPLPPDPGEFVGTRALAGILERLASRAHLVLIDAPSLVSLGDALALSGKVDGVFVVCRLKLVRRQLVEELKRLLSSCRAHKLGFAVTGAELEADYYGYGYKVLDEPPAEPAEPVELVQEAAS